MKGGQGGDTDLVGVLVAEEEVGGFDVGMHIFMLVDVLQYVQLEVAEEEKYYLLLFFFKSHLLQ